MFPGINPTSGPALPTVHLTFTQPRRINRPNLTTLYSTCLIQPTGKPKGGKGSSVKISCGCGGRNVDESFLPKNLPKKHFYNFNL